MQVNLRPVEYTRQKQFYWPRLFKVIVACFFVLALAFAAISLRLDEQRLLTEQIVLRSEAEKLKPVVEEFGLLQEKANKHKEKQGIIDRLAAEALVWSDYLAELHAGIEEDVTIVDFASDFGGSIIIRAQAGSMRLASALAFRIGEMQSFDNVAYEIIVLSEDEFEVRITAILAGEESAMNDG